MQIIRPLGLLKASPFYPWLKRLIAQEAMRNERVRVISLLTKPLWMSCWLASKTNLELKMIYQLNLPLRSRRRSTLSSKLQSQLWSLRCAKKNRCSTASRLISTWILTTVSTLLRLLNSKRKEKSNYWRRMTLTTPRKSRKLSNAPRQQSTRPWRAWTRETRRFHRK